MKALWFEQALLAEGWSRRVRMTVENGRIKGIETDVDPSPDDDLHGAALPGMGNLHSHSFQRGMAGLAELRGSTTDSFWTWREIMYRFANRIGPDELQAIAAQAFAEMLESGFTHVGEFHYVHHDADGKPFANPAEMGSRIAAAAEEVGIGLTLLPVLYMASGFGGRPANAEQHRFLSGIDDYARLLSETRSAVSRHGMQVGVAPHSLRAVTPDALTVAVALADGAPIHIHIAEQVREVEDSIAWSGLPPVRWLMENADVDERWCLVHATHMTREEIAMLAASGAVAGLCPITEANLGDGIFPALPYLEAGGAFGIGSDSNILIDVAEELRGLEYSQRLHHRSRNVLASADATSTGRRLFDDAISGGARALGIAAHGLRPGAVINMLALDCSHPTLWGKQGDELLDGWIFGGGRGMIDTVWTDGVRRVAQGRHVAREPIRQRYREALGTLLLC